MVDLILLFWNPFVFEEFGLFSSNPASGGFKAKRVKLPLPTLLLLFSLMLRKVCLGFGLLSWALVFLLVVAVFWVDGCYYLGPNLYLL